MREAITQLNAISRTVEVLRGEMNRFAQQLPEYPVVMAMYGAGPSLGPQLMTEIGAVRRFAHPDPGNPSVGAIHHPSAVHRI